MNTLNQQFSQKLHKLEQALNLCNEMFYTSPNWQALTEEDRLRFALYVMKAFQKI